MEDYIEINDEELEDLFLQDQMNYAQDIEEQMSGLKEELSEEAYERLSRLEAIRKLHWIFDELEKELILEDKIDILDAANSRFDIYIERVIIDRMANAEKE